MADIAIRVENLSKQYRLAFVAAMRLGLKTWMLPDLALELAERGSLTAERTEVILEVIRPPYRVGVIEHSLESSAFCRRFEARELGDAIWQ